MAWDCNIVVVRVRDYQKTSNLVGDGSQENDREVKVMFKIASVVSLLLISINVNAQIKIGDIEISEKLAKEYFFDCYNKPDTVRVYRVGPGPKHISLPDFYDDLGNKYFNTKTIEKTYPRGRVKSQSYKKRLYGIYLKTRVPSKVDFAEWYRNYKGKM